MRVKVFVCGVCLLLSACASVPARQIITYSLPATPGGRLCVQQCEKSRGFCRESCDLDHRACISEAQAKAQREYENYTTERYRKHLPAEFLPSDFERDDACSAAKKHCFADCDSPYNSCYLECGGQVKIETSCQFFCFE
jgi:hypothetical protein